MTTGTYPPSGGSGGGGGITNLTGDVTAVGPGSVPATVAAIQGETVTGTTGTGKVVFDTSPTLVTPALGTPSSGNLSNCTGYPASGITGTLGVDHGGTGATTLTANGVLLGNTTSPVTVTAAGTTTQVLAGNTGSAPTFQTLTVGAAGSSPNSGGGSFSGTTLTLQPADSTNPGIISTSAQTIAGAKTFSGGVTFNANITNGQGTSSISGANANLVHTRSYMQLTNAALTSIATAATSGVSVGHEIYIENATGNSVTIINNYGSPGVNQGVFITSTGQDVTLVNGAIIIVLWNGTEWHLVDMVAGSFSGVLPIANGGTNSSTALNNNRVMQSSGGKIQEAAAITTSRALVSDTNGIPVAATTTTTQVNYLSGATGTTGTTTTNLVFSTSPTLVTPTLGAATATSINKMAITAPATSSTLAVADGKTFTASNTLTVTATDGSTAAFGGGGTVDYVALNQYDMNIGNASNVKQPINTNLIGGVQAIAIVQTFTVTIATPGVFSLTSHGYSEGQKIYFTTTGALPTGLSANTAYWVHVVNANSFNVSTTLANLEAATYVATSGSQSGTHSSYSSGLTLTASSMDAVQATKLGLMNYSHGTNYNGGVAPTITLASGGGTLTSVIRSQFLPYQTIDSTWRLKFSAVMQVSSTARTGIAFAVNGVTSKNTSNWLQPIVGYGDAASPVMLAYCAANSSNIMTAEFASATQAFYRFYGDIELNSKPSWAY